MEAQVQQPDTDRAIDSQILECLSLANPKSFFLFAGAGSGKTRSLVNVLSAFKAKSGQTLYQNRQKVAIITYTNAACQEIIRRLEYDTLFSVSTIHSFVWDLICTYQNDIRDWLKSNLLHEINRLKEEQVTGRPGSKAAVDRVKKIESKTKRLGSLDSIKKFTYSPTGDNRTRDSLNHAEVINITADFLQNKPLMRQILVKKFPALLIDESQDTQKELIDALFLVQAENPTSFALGLFGDTMQRIYSDGKENLGRNLPADWIKPAKLKNHRCPKRVVKLINKIRESVDDQVQVPRDDKEEGLVRLFLIPGNVSDKAAVEKSIAMRMATLTKDDLWENEIKILTLEHHMAARRMGFLELFEPLYKVERLRTGLIDGTLSGIRFFTQLVLPLVLAKQARDEFAVARIVRKHSALLKEESFKNSPDQNSLLKAAGEAVNSMFALWKDKTPQLLAVLTNINESGLFPIPDNLSIIARRTKEEQRISGQDTVGEYDEDEEGRDQVIDAWDAVMNCSFDQVLVYHEYITDKAKYATHQGVKGLQFPRVFVIIDDEEAKGFLFSYEKLFGAKEASVTDRKNMQDGRETSSDRTKRLFYVACSRAEKSLAIAFYTSNPTLVKAYVLQSGWFTDDEIELLE